MNSFTAFVVKWREKFEQAQEKHEEVIKSAGVKNASAITSELNKVIQAIETIDNDLRDAKKALNQKVALTILYVVPLCPITQLFLVVFLRKD